MQIYKISVILALLGVVMGAFGAHALNDILIENDSFAAWKTATLYHLTHALALFILASLPQRFSRRVFLLAAGSWIAGIILFSGSLYALSLTGWRVLGPITPVGGLLLITGWGTLLFATPDKR